MAKAFRYSKQLAEEREKRERERENRVLAVDRWFTLRSASFPYALPPHLACLLYYTFSTLGSADYFNITWINLLDTKSFHLLCTTVFISGTGDEY